MLLLASFFFLTLVGVLVWNVMFADKPHDKDPHLQANASLGVYSRKAPEENVVIHHHRVSVFFGSQTGTAEGFARSFVVSTT